MTEPSDQPITIISEEQAARTKAALKRADEPKRWRFGGLATDVAAAMEFANAEPAQGAGEAFFSVRGDGTVDMFLFY